MVSDQTEAVRVGVAGWAAGVLAVGLDVRAPVHGGLAREGNAPALAAHLNKIGSEP